MAKHNLAAVASREPDEHYDTLSQPQKDIHDDLAIQGWTPTWNGLQWNATHRTGVSIGPELTLAALRKAAKKAGVEDDGVIDAEIIDIEEAAEAALEETEEEQIDIDNPEMIVLEDDGLGNPFLPGTEPAVIAPL